MPLPLLLLAALLAPPQTSAPAQPATAAQPIRELQAHPDWPAAKPADVDSPRSIVAAFFSAISAAKGTGLDRDRLRSLFTPNGRIEIPLPGSGGKPTDVLFMTPDGYAAMSDGSTATSGFFDHLLAVHVQKFGVIAHGWAAYESRNDPTDPKPFVRGVKSFELLQSGSRWYITQVSWDRERAGNPIPSEYLSNDAP